MFIEILKKTHCCHVYRNLEKFALSLCRTYLNIVNIKLYTNQTIYVFIISKLVAFILFAILIIFFML